jgi:hypothetical protein
MKKHLPPKYQDRISLLQEFLDDVKQWGSVDRGSEERSQFRSKINRNLAAVRVAVADIGLSRRLNLVPPRVVGGPMAENVDPFNMIFETWYGDSFIPTIVDVVEEAIGAYEQLNAGNELIRPQLPETIDIESAIERALRPSFRHSPPSCEREVQDAVENTLNALGVEFVREKEGTTVGPRTFRPDFALPRHDLAIEIKLAGLSHSASKIQEEIATDISAYRTKWKRILIIIYDNGVIADPYQMRRDNMKNFGVSIVIVKH